MAQSEHYKALNLELHQQHSFIRFFNGLPEKTCTTVRIFSRSDYYTVHGSDAALASDITSIPLKVMGEEPKLSYLCLNKGQFETFIRELLLVRQYRVEVYTKAGQGKGGNDWQVEFKGSPGNLSQFEDLLFDNPNVEYTNSVMAVNILQNKKLAIGSVNTTEGKFEVCEITDNEAFSELESLIAQVSPKECLIPAGETAELKNLHSLLDRNGIFIGRCKKTDFSFEDVAQDLNRLLFFHEDQPRNAALYPETNLKEAMGCLQALIKFLDLTTKEENFNQFKLSTLDCHRFLRLDNAALYALHVIPNVGEKQDVGKNASIKDLLDHCVTPQGHRLLEQWIRQPLRDYNLINERLDVVVALVKDPETRTCLSKDILPRITDLMTLSRKLLCKKATLQDCYRVYETVSNLPRIIQILSDMRDHCVKNMLATPLTDILNDMQNYQAMIEQTLDLDLVDRGEFLIISTYNDELNDLRKEKEKIEEKMLKIVHGVCDDLDMERKNVRLERTDHHGFFFRVTLKEEKALRKKKHYTIIDVINSGVRFTTDKMKELNAKYQDVNRKYEEQQKEVVKEVFEVAAGYADLLKTLNMHIATLDVLVSFAISSMASRVPYVKPKLHKEGAGILRLEKLRHPCLEAQDHISVIPNDVNLDENDKILYIITGPNMCGKSTYIRSVGICVLMAHIGCLVPCREAEISLVDGILVRVGADDCQLKGLSTFMLEMIETSTILKSASRNSLVIIDELGRGTSTFDGCGIAMAIAEHLVKDIKCFSLFATHFHEISRLAEQYDNVGNLHVTAVTTESTITPLYQVKQGECEKSYGIYCARMVDFPEDVIQDAVEIQEKLEHHSGMKYIVNFEPSIKKNVVMTGDAIIEKTLNSLGVANMDPNELMNKIKELRRDLETSDNLFIKGLLSCD